MYQLTKLTIGSKICSLTETNISKPILSIISPICLFNFKIQVEAFVPPNDEVELLTTIWELTEDFGDGNVQLLSTLETDGNLTEVVFPRELLKENTNYLIRAYFLTTIGESDWSENINIKSGFVDVINFEPMNLSNPDYDQGKHCVINCDNVTYDLIFNEAEKLIYIYKYDSLNNSWSAVISYGTGLNFYGIGGKNSDGDVSYQPFSYCVSSDNKIYFTCTITGEFVNNHSTLIGIYLFKFDPTASIITLLSSDNTGVFKRDAPAMCYYNNSLYFFGGYQVDTTGLVITPDEDEKTIVKYNLATLLFSEVIVNGTIKPKNYRETKCAVVGNGIFTFSGTGVPLSDEKSLELWYFNFISLEWEVKPMFTLSSLDKCYITMDVDINNQYLNVAIKYANSFKIELFNFFIESNYWEDNCLLCEFQDTQFHYLSNDILHVVSYETPH